MTLKIPRVHVFSANDFRNWLKKNHLKENIVELVIHKKHTGKPFPSHHELMLEGISFGWIDTVARRIDADRFIRTFQRRNKNSNWSTNTLSYAKNLIKQGKMTHHGMHFYKLGLQKKPHDYGIPKNPPVPADLEKELDKNKIAKENFARLAPSTRRTYLRWLFRTKMPETRKRRINQIIERMFQGKMKIEWSKKNAN